VTALKRPVRRETAASIRDAGRLLPIIVEIHPAFMLLRQKGCRRKYSLTYQSAYLFAVRQAVEETRRQKKAERSKGNRDGRR